MRWAPPTQEAPVPQEGPTVRREARGLSKWVNRRNSRHSSYLRWVWLYALMVERLVEARHNSVFIRR
jgi:hypothetical protein